LLDDIRREKSVNIIAINLFRAFGMRSRGAEAGSLAARRPFAYLQNLAAALRVLPLRARNVVPMVHEWWRLRRAVVDLQSMPDRMLRDIGLTREEIGHAVRFGRDSLF
jgi:uncharacterized protein YjiS (DUF1127 family)